MLEFSSIFFTTKTCEKSQISQVFFIALKITYNMEQKIEETFLKIFPQVLTSAILRKVNLSQINEIRLRAGRPVVVLLGANSYFLSENGITNKENEAIVISKTDIENIVFRASECSIYAVNDQIKQGFLTIEGGVRIGLAGTAVCEGSDVKTLKNFTSIVVRIPHVIRNCSLSCFRHILENGKFHSTLIISPPGGGKTTFLRDFLFQLSSRNICFNVLLLDERGEIAGGTNLNLLDSNFCDVLSFIPKKQGFVFGIRALSPGIVACDELGDVDDLQAIEFAANCGVGTIATVHASSVSELVKKPNFEKLLEKKIFERYVVLSSREGPGTFEGIYDENFSVIFRGEE